MKRLDLDSLDIILMKMFQIVGETYSREYIQEPQWFLKHKWTLEQEQEFETWLTAYFKSSKVQRELFDTVITDLTTRRKRAKWFIFNYGWKYEG
jgi:hypothetical protein